MSYNITILKTAHIDCANSVIYKGGDFNETTTIGCHAFLLNKGGEYYLIDTGIEDIKTANTTKSSVDDWKRSAEEHSVKENLELLKVPCDKISKVFFTHAHYDHISGVCHFKNAVFYMTKTEYAELYSEDNRNKKVLKDAKEFLKDKELVLFDDELTVDDIKLKLRGGHTKGSMSVELDGKIFVGDTIFVHDNLKRKIPAGYTADREASDRLLDEYLSYDKQLITSHDFNEVV